MDWSFAKSLSEKEQMRLWVETWRRTGPELKRIKRAELRALTDDEARIRIQSIMNSQADELWIDPRHRTTSGLIEQQRFFQQHSSVPRRD